LPPKADPGAVVATEIAFAQAAQKDGQWTAFHDFAADGAVMFVPQPVDARDWLAKQTDPPRAVAWQPQEVWSSCDGTLAVTRGAWQRPDGSTGYFTTVWKAEARRGEEPIYRWVLDQGDALAEPLPAPDIIRTKVADCDAAGGLTAKAATRLALPAEGGGASRDATLAYRWEVGTDLARKLVVTMLLDGKAVKVLDLAVAAPQD
jgi:hypothetical protein